jgi:flagellar biogenesis protein FliO
MNSFSQNDIPPIRLLGTLNIAPKKSIAMVEICDQWLVVGIGVENINLLTKLERPQAVDNQEYRFKNHHGTFQSFLQDIRSVKNKGKSLIPR